MVLDPYEKRILGQSTLTQSTIQYFRKKFGKRFIRALRAVEENRVIRYHFLPSDTCTWIVKGKKREYLVIPEIYCSCRSFYQDVVIAREFEMCYHILAQSIAAIRGEYEKQEATDVIRRALYPVWRKTE